MPAYPISLPAPMVDGYGLELVDKLARTDMEVGSPRVRLRSSARIDQVTAVWRFKADEMAAFRAWYESQSGYNFVQYSEDFSAGIWAKAGAGTGTAPTVTPNAAAAPDGSNTADLVAMSIGAGTAATDRSEVQLSIPATVGVNLVFSLWMRSNDASTYTVRTDFGGLGGGNNTVTPSWQRFSAAVTNTLNTGYRPFIRLRGASGTSSAASVLLWGAQLTQGVTLMPYLPVLDAGPAVSGIGFGASFFDITLPLGNNGFETRQARFMAPPKFALTAQMIWTVSAQLEVR